MTLTPVALSDLDALHGLSVEVDWPHRVDDWRLGLEVGRGFVARDETGTIGGCALWFPYGEAAAAIGMERSCGSTRPSRMVRLPRCWSFVV